MHRLSIALGCALIAACAHQGPQPTTAEGPAVAPVNAPPTPTPAVPPTAPVPAEGAPSAPVAAAEGTEAAAPAPSAPAAPAGAAPKAPAAPARTTTVPAKPAAAAPPAAATPPAAPPAAGTLDLGSLEQRLKDTRAIGVFTKLSLKNQVDDLLKQFRTYHQGNSKQTLAQLRQHYELLLLKVVSLLQDDDPKLAAAVGSSREAIWSVLSDPKKFATLDA